MPGTKSNYYRLPDLWAIPLVPFGMALVTAAAFAPHLIPYSYLGPIGTLTSYLVTNVPSLLTAVAVGAWMLHVGEAYYATMLCEKKNISDNVKPKWALTVFVYGVFALKHLLAYKPEKSK